MIGPNKRPPLDSYYQPTEFDRPYKKIKTGFDETLELDNYGNLSPLFDFSEEDYPMGQEEKLFTKTESSTNEIETDSSSEDNDLTFSLDEFFKKIKDFAILDDYQKRIDALWNSLQVIPQTETEECEGRSCWIVDPLTGTSGRCMLFRIYQEAFSSTSISIKALSEQDRSKKWYKIEMAEYIYDEPQGRNLRNLPGEYLLEMHLGMISGIDWIRKGINFNGAEVKRVAMKLGKYLGGRKETLYDTSQIPSGIKEGNYSMRQVFSLIHHDKFPNLSWYERDGYVAMNCNNIPDFNGVLITQDNVAYYKALKKLREMKISHLYCNIIQGIVSKQKIFQAYKLLPKIADIKESKENGIKRLIADKERNLSELLGFLWQNRSSNKSCKQLFDYIYTNILNKLEREYLDSSKDVNDWNKNIFTLGTTQFFIRSAGNNDSDRLTKLLNQLENPQAVNELRKLGSLY